MGGIGEGLGSRLGAFKLGGHAAVLASSLYLAVHTCTSDKDLTEESALHTARNQIRKYAMKDTQVAALTNHQT